MRWTHPVGETKQKTWAIALAAAAGLLAPRNAQAHFHLDAPDSWSVQTTAGDMQKEAPCGIASPTSQMLTGKITTFRPGQTITVKWTETVAHDGHFRISLALTSRDELHDPVTTSDANNQSLTAVVEAQPKLPTLLDGLFEHLGNSIQVPKAYSQDVTLPNVTCTKCTLQVIQFMAHHPPGYFYHHCADISIQGPLLGDAGAGSDGAAGHGASGNDGGAASDGGAGGSMSGGTGGAGGGAGMSGGSGGAGAGAGGASTSGTAGHGGSDPTGGTAMGGAGSPGAGGAGDTAGSAPVAAQDTGCSLATFGRRGSTHWAAFGSLLAACVLVRQGSGRRRAVRRSARRT